MADDKNVALPVRWMPPETFASVCFAIVEDFWPIAALIELLQGKFQHSSDVWSFGMTLFEVKSDKLAHKTCACFYLLSFSHSARCHTAMA